MKMQFVRLDDHDPPCLVLVEPSGPSKRAQIVLEAAGFELWSEYSEWWAPLASLGRRDIADWRLVAVARQGGSAATTRWGRLELASQPITRAPTTRGDDR